MTIDVDRLASNIIEALSDSGNALPYFALKGQVYTADQLIEIHQRPWLPNRGASDMFKFVHEDYYQEPALPGNGGPYYGEHQIVDDFAAAALEAQQGAPALIMRFVPNSSHLKYYRLPMAICWPVIHGWELAQGYGPPDRVNRLLTRLPQRAPIPKAARIRVIVPVGCIDE